MISTLNWKNKFCGFIHKEYHTQQPKIILALNLARDAHADQRREFEAEPYVIHPVRVAYHLGLIGIEQHNPDYELVIAGLLHDVIEDTQITSNQIRENYGENISYLVEGVTKIPDNHHATIQKIVKYGREDLRVVILKLADMTDNVQSLHKIDREKSERLRNKYLQVTDALYCEFKENRLIRGMCESLLGFLN